MKNTDDNYLKKHKERLEQILLELEEELFLLAYDLSKDWHLSEDIVQETILIVLNKIQKNKLHISLSKQSKDCLYILTKRVARSMIKNQEEKLTPQLMRQIQKESQYYDYETVVHILFDRLYPDRRNLIRNEDIIILHLRYVKQYNCQRIAWSNCITHVTARKRLERAKKRLKVYLF